MQPEIAFGDGFFQSAARLAPADSRRVHKAIDQLRRDPDHPSLNLEPIEKSRRNRLHTIRASQFARILLAREGNVFTLIEAGAHDDIYERANRGAFVFSAATGFIGFAHPPETLPPEAQRWQVARRMPADDMQDVVAHWTDDELVEVAGLSEAVVEGLRRCTHPDDVFGLDLDNDMCDLVFEVMEKTPDSFGAPVLDEPAEAEARIRQAIRDSGASWGLSPLFTPQEVEAILAAPIEDWMVFLHPLQREVVDRSFSGPARVKGAPGTGKTVVALHRAARLAKESQALGDPPVLFTTFIKTLPPVFEHLFARLPGAPADHVEFVHIDRLANRLYRESGGGRHPDPKATDAAFDAAFRQVVKSGTPLAADHITRNYLRDEITAVIKGRGLQTLDEYLQVERIGRQMPLRDKHRRQVWELRQAWDQEMESRGTIDFPDIQREALRHARSLDEPTYSAAIIEEAQDLTLVGLRLVRALVNGPSAQDPPDGLFLVGDAAQRIYPGGFRLGHAGINVSGRRSVELHHHYRSTRQILEAAYAVAGDGVVEDMGEVFRRGDASIEIERDGLRPVLATFQAERDERDWLVDFVKRSVEVEGIGLGDIGVLVTTNQAAGALLEALRRSGLRAQNLKDYAGEETDAVKVGTWHRAKGLEFKVVCLPGLSAGKWPWPRRRDQSSAEHEEAYALDIGRLFVAMTRARDHLVVSCVGEPTEKVAAAASAFEKR